MAERVINLTYNKDLMKVNELKEAADTLQTIFLLFDKVKAGEITDVQDFMNRVEMYREWFET